MGVNTINNVVLMGNLARDPETVTTQNGIVKCNFTVACQRRFANAQGVREADFINCVAWRQTGEFVSRWFHKGSKIALVGSIQVRSYDAQDGSKRWITEVVVDNVEFAGSRQDGDGSGAQASTRTATQSQQANQQRQRDFNSMEGFTEVDDSDELPF